MRKSLYIVMLFAFAVCILSRCVSNSTGQADKRGADYADESTCIKCHKEVENSYTHTAHYSTSAPVNQAALQQLYHTAADSFSFFNEQVKVEKKGDEFYQTLYQNSSAVNTQQFDIAFGSGEKAQSFAYWKDAQLFQLPLSYFKAIPGWANSPDFPAHKANFNRAIISRCFECHASYVEKTTVQNGSLSVKEVLNAGSVVYGIDCQRCHGPAAEHVQFHTDNPTERKAKFIVSWAGLNRQQKLDACAVCHSGNDMDMQRSTFAFKPGDTLSNFYLPAFASASSVDDVHGKQMQLLAASACFRKSQTLECSSCHNPHKSEKNDLANFSKQCMTCHQPADEHFCKMAAMGEAVKTNCIDCHMPEQASKTITFQKAGQDTTTPYFLRTHRIAIYSEATAAILIKLKGFNHAASTVNKKL